MKTRILLILAAFCLFFGSAAAQSSAANTQISRGYLIGPGDVLSLKALGEKDFDVDAITVDEDGKIQIPYVDEPIIASCKTERELQAEVAKRWSKFLKNPQVSLHVTQRNHPPVTVTGEVVKQDQFAPMRRITLLEVLSAAGGPTNKSAGMIQLVRTRPPMCADATALENWKQETSSGLGVSTRIYSYNAVSQGREEANPEIFPGDIINVPKAAPFYITGEVLKAGEFDLPAGGLPLTQAIAQAAPTRDAKVKGIKIYRQKQGTTQPEVIVANLQAIETGKEKDPLLQPFDIVEVGKAPETFNSFMTKLLIGLPQRVPIPIP